MNRPDQPYDWERFWIHFVCGALLGGVFGDSFREGFLKFIGSSRWWV